MAAHASIEVLKREDWDSSMSMTLSLTSVATGRRYISGHSLDVSRAVPI